MKEYIEREKALLARPEYLNPNNGDYNKGWNDCISTIYGLVLAIPVADVQEVRHREWKGYTTSAYIGSEDEYGDPRYANRRFYRCSECHYGSVVKSKFCPSCGAIMDKEIS